MTKEQLDEKLNSAMCFVFQTIAVAIAATAVNLIVLPWVWYYFIR